MQKLKDYEDSAILSTIAKELWNRKFPAHDMPATKVTIQAMHRNTYGHMTTKPVWKRGEDALFYEININPTFLNRSIGEVLTTLLHELVHLFNLSQDIQDVSRGGTYHNKRFKTACDAVGLTAVRTDKYGYSTSATTQTDELLQELNDLYTEIAPNEHVFDIRLDPHAIQPPRGKGTNGGADGDGDGGADGDGDAPAKKQTSFRHECPTCGAIARTTRATIRLKCGDCDEVMSMS